MSYYLLTNGQVGWEIPSELVDHNPDLAAHGYLKPYTPAPGWRILRHWKSSEWTKGTACGEWRFTGSNRRA